MKSQSQVKDDDKIVSINDRQNPMVAIVGKPEEGDQRFVSVVDLGDIDKSRTTGADSAYNYLNGEPGQFKIMTTAPPSPIKIMIYTIAVFAAGGLATWFTISI